MNGTLKLRQPELSCYYKFSRFELADEGRYKEARGKQSGKRLLAVDGQSLYVDQTRTVWLTCDVVGLFGQMERQG